MPLILAENEITESGLIYADLTGKSYQFPRVYRRQIVPGEYFIYYRGRKRRHEPRAPQQYFGTGMVSSVELDSTDPTRLIAFFTQYRHFSTPVPFKLGGKYLERDGARRGYFQKGVRPVTVATFRRILRLADLL